MDCPCPPWYSNTTEAVGTNTYDGYIPEVAYNHVPGTCAEDPAVAFQTAVDYACPPGYALDTTGIEPAPPESRFATYTCAAYGLWYPPIQPRCIGEFSCMHA